MDFRLDSRIGSSPAVDARRIDSEVLGNYSCWQLHLLSSGKTDRTWIERKKRNLSRQEFFPLNIGKYVECTLFYGKLVWKAVDRGKFHRCHSKLFCVRIVQDISGIKTVVPEGLVGCRLSIIHNMCSMGVDYLWVFCCSKAHIRKLQSPPLVINMWCVVPHPGPSVRFSDHVAHHLLSFLCDVSLSCLLSTPLHIFMAHNIYSLCSGTPSCKLRHL